MLFWCILRHACHMEWRWLPRGIIVSRGNHLLTSHIVVCLEPHRTPLDTIKYHRNELCHRISILFKMQSEWFEYYLLDLHNRCKVTVVQVMFVLTTVGVCVCVCVCLQVLGLATWSWTPWCVCTTMSSSPYLSTTYLAPSPSCCHGDTVAIRGIQSSVWMNLTSLVRL